ncbi:hypothetical protein [Cutibacterium acnes]|uniref:hypothetical protein n=1 Tax=Cutibacterium acnes TaxID=1747 RepID=UPI001EF28AD4|nr:hypothetical protein [Cutibacterium acnes]
MSCAMVVDDGDEVLLSNVVGPAQWHHPRPFLRVTVVGHLVKILGGEEPRIAHETLIDGAELVDAELGVADIPALPALPAVLLFTQ